MLNEIVCYANLKQFISMNSYSGGIPSHDKSEKDIVSNEESWI